MSDYFDTGDHNPGDCKGENPCGMCREYREYRKADAKARAKVTGDLIKATNGLVGGLGLVAIPIPDPEEVEPFYICKCGFDMEGPVDELTVCPACKRWGCWAESEDQDE